MPAYPNPVYRSVLARLAAPFVPVWLFGLVLAVTLGRLGLATTDPSGLDWFVLAFSAVVLLLIGVLAASERRRAPGTVDLDVDRISGAGPGAGTIDFGTITAIRGGGFYGCRVEARIPEGRGTDPRRLDWLYLTRDNAERLSLAVAAWRERESSEGAAAA